MKFRIKYGLSASENAQVYYRKSKKARKKVDGAKKALDETRRRIDALLKERESEAETGQEPSKKKRRKRKRWYEKFRFFYSSDNFLVVGGKDATTNEILIKKHLEKNDLVFHADIQGAPFFIIKNPDGRDIPEATLEEAAEAAASYSKAWASGRGNCDVYYVKPEQISKETPPGEYMSKGAFMVYGRRVWLRNTPLRIGIGFKVDDEVGVIGGPIRAVSRNADYVVKISVGDKKSKELANDIKNAVLKRAKKAHREEIKKTNLDDIQRWIPGGKGRLMMN